MRQLVWQVAPQSFLIASEQCGEKWLTLCASEPGSALPRNATGEEGVNSRRDFESSVLQICKYIGNSQLLFSKFAQMCLRRSLEPPSPQHGASSSSNGKNEGADNSTDPKEGEGEAVVMTEPDARWCTLLRLVLVQLPRDKIRALGKLLDMAWQLNNFIRESKLNPEHKQNTITDRNKLAARIKANNVVLSSIHSRVVDLRRVFVSLVEKPPSTSNTKLPTTKTKSPRTLPPRPAAVVRETSSSLRESLSLDEKLRKFWDELHKHDANHKKIFSRPVTEVDAPGYFDVVSHPMDLSKMKRRLPTEQYRQKVKSDAVYKCVEDFETDVKLIIKNCHAYNSPNTVVYKAAEKLWKAWLKIKQKVDGSGEVTATQVQNQSSVPRPPPPPPPARKLIKVEGINRKESMTEIDNIECATGPAPNDQDESLIKVEVKEEANILPVIPKQAVEESMAPLRLSIKSKKEDKGQESVAVEEGCVSGQSRQVRDDSLIKKKEEAKTSQVIPKQAVEESMAPLKLSIKSYKISKKRQAESGTVAGKVGNKRKGIHPLQTVLEGAVALMTKVANDQSIGGDLAGAFSEPVTDAVAPEYSTIIKFPMDLRTLRRTAQRGGYKSVDEFESDLKLIFDNCREYNGPTSPLSKFGELLWNFWVLNRDTIESNPNAKLDELQPIGTKMENNGSTKKKKKKIQSSNNEKGSKQAKKHVHDVSDDNIEGLQTSRGNSSSLIGHKKGSDISKFDKDVNHQLKPCDNNFTSNSPAVTDMKLKAEVSESSEEKSTKSHQSGEDYDVQLYKILNKSLDLVWDVESNEDLHGDFVGLFSNPVTEADVPGYFNMVKDPIDFTVMDKKMDNYDYKSVDDFEKDLKLMFNNCKIVNVPGSPVVMIADNIWDFWKVNRRTIEKNPDVEYKDCVPARFIMRPFPVLAPLPEDKIEIESSHMLQEALERAVSFLSSHDKMATFAADVSLSHRHIYCPVVCIFLLIDVLC